MLFLISASLCTPRASDYRNQRRLARLSRLATTAPGHCVKGNQEHPVKLMSEECSLGYWKYYDACSVFENVLCVRRILVSMVWY